MKPPISSESITIALILGLVLGGCTHVHQKPVFLTGEENVALEDGEPLFTTIGPKGVWTYYESWRNEGLFYIDGGAPYEAVGYSARLRLQNLKNANKKIQRVMVAKLKSGDYQQAIQRKLKDFYTDRFRKDSGLSSVSGSVTEVAGFKCTRFEEVQDYGPPSPGERWNSLIRVLSSSVSCPVVVDGELWGLYVSYRISIDNERFHNTYGPSAPTDETLVRDIEERLKPMLEDIKFHREVSQNYDDLSTEHQSMFESDVAPTRE